MKYDYDVTVIGTGTSAYFVVNNCLAANLKVAVVDRREYGGTCAMRGCQPKKYLIAAAEAVERCRRMQGIGVRNIPQIDWPALMRSKNAFTEPIPKGTEEGFREKGARTLHGVARFTGTNSIEVDGREISAKHIVIATGAVPRPLNIPGEEYLNTSDQFLDLDQMPERVIFVGGGFISMEFAGIAAVCGAEVTLLQKGARMLTRFDQDLVEVLEDAYREAGIHIFKNACVDRIEQEGSDLVAGCIEMPDRGFRGDLIVHGAGRIPALEDLNLEAGSIDYSPKGVTVNPYLQSVSNPSVYAIGDVAATTYQLATTADLEGEIASRNIISGNREAADVTVVPSVVFSLPPLASVGLQEVEARQSGMDIIVNRGDMTRWPSSRRIGQTHSSFKIIQAAKSGRILGAHLLGHNADEVINIFAMAVRLKLTGADLKGILWAYPTYSSDLKYMVS
jgi:glutathione reductase (NADPH)